MLVYIVACHNLAQFGHRILTCVLCGLVWIHIKFKDVPTFTPVKVLLQNLVLLERLQTAFHLNHYTKKGHIYKLRSSLWTLAWPSCFLRKICTADC